MDCTITDYSEFAENLNSGEENINSTKNKRKRWKDDDNDDLNKYDDALIEILKLANAPENIDEFDTFGKSIADNLRKLPELMAYETMHELQNIVSNQVLMHLRTKQLNAPTYTDQPMNHANIIDTNHQIKIISPPSSTFIPGNANYTIATNPEVKNIKINNKKFKIISVQNLKYKPDIKKRNILQQSF